MESTDKRYEYIQSFLIVDERILNTRHISGIDWTNTIISLLLFLSFLVVLPIIIEFKGIWYFFGLGMLVFMLFYGLQSRLEVIFVVTKFRIIELGVNPILERISRSFSPGSFRDIHYSQVESIYHGVPRYNPNRLWIGMFLISLSWAFSVSQGKVLNGESPLLPLIILLLILGIISIFISLPLGKKRLEIRSMGGSTISIASGLIDSKFMDDIIDASRTFQTYGAT